MEKDAELLRGIQVTDICYDCLRRAYYQILSRERGGEQEYKGMRESDWLRVWIGKKLHETDFSELHELNVNALGVHGRIDEILVTDREVVIVDKKSTRKIPSRPYDHHVKQVQYYAALLVRSELSALLDVLKGKAFYGAVLYIDVNEGLCEVSVFPLNPYDPMIEKEITEKVAVLRRAFSEGKPPEPSAGFLCDYCDFLYHCVREGSKP
jgi:CRISPR/Cas system-associated exonuclease Cas4 (RecB family)